jgi:hypothetical protein
MSNLTTAQELYDKTREEVLMRYAARGIPAPSELEIFRTLVKSVREAVEKKECPPEFLKELEEVLPATATRKKASLIINPFED